MSTPLQHAQHARFHSLPPAARSAAAAAALRLTDAGKWVALRSYPLFRPRGCERMFAHLGSGTDNHPVPVRAVSTKRRPTAPGNRRVPPWAVSVPGPQDALPDQVQQFLDMLRIQRNRPLTTVRGYRSDLAKFVAFQRTLPRQDAFCGGVDHEALRRYQVELAMVVPNPRSRARALVALRGFLAYAYQEGWIGEELTRFVLVPRFPVGDPHPVRTATVPLLLAALPRETLRDQRDRALVHFLISTGCRIGEALMLDRGDVQREGFRVLGKGGKHRTVYCTEAAFEAVQEYLGVRGADESPALFISVARADLQHNGRAHAHNRLTTDGARTALTALRRRFSADPQLFALIADLRTPHAARHTAATTLLEATDGDVRLVQEVLGHATLETLRVYTEITDGRKRAAYLRLDAYLDEVGRKR